MIHLANIHNASERIKSRAARMWTVQESHVDAVFVYRVVPHGEGFDHNHKAKRTVTIDVEQGTAECVDRNSNEPCQANANYVIETGQAKRPRLCAHVYAVLKRLKAVDEVSEAQAA